jgi:hypothetical protein
LDLWIPGAVVDPWIHVDELDLWIPVAVVDLRLLLSVFYFAA